MHRRLPRNPKLAAAMAEHGHSVASLSAAAGLYWTTVSRILNLRTLPTRDTADRIARVLNTTPKALGWDEFAHDRRGACLPKKGGAA